MGRSCGKPPGAFIPGYGLPQALSPSLSNGPAHPPGQAFLTACPADQCPARQQEAKAACPAGLRGPAQGLCPVVGPDSWATSCHKLPPACKECPNISGFGRSPFIDNTKPFISRWKQIASTPQALGCTLENCFALRRYSCKKIPQLHLRSDLLRKQKGPHSRIQNTKALNLLWKSLMLRTAASRLRQRQLQKWSKKLGQT